MIFIFIVTTAVLEKTRWFITRHRIFDGKIWRNKIRLIFKKIFGRKGWTKWRKDELSGEKGEIKEEKDEQKEKNK